MSNLITSKSMAAKNLRLTRSLNVCGESFKVSIKEIERLKFDCELYKEGVSRLQAQLRAEKEKSAEYEFTLKVLAKDNGLRKGSRIAQIVLNKHSQNETE